VPKFLSFFSTFKFLLMIPKHGFSCKSAIALAPDTAHVFGHVPFEHIFAGQNLVAETAGRAAQVNLIVGTAG
jgi:hypothetical protein